MVDMRSLSSGDFSSEMTRPETKPATLPPPFAREPGGNFDGSHFGVLPPHKPSRRNRYVRARRRGLWKEGV
jgi:hypothetical protein